jgi:hypothetical protein
MSDLYEKLSSLKGPIHLWGLNWASISGQLFFLHNSGFSLLYMCIFCDHMHKILLHATLHLRDYFQET